MSAFLIAALAAAATSAPLRAELQPFGYLVGRCWAGTLPDGKTDTHCFQPALQGQHVRDRHRVGEGKPVYEGETLYSWDGEKFVFTYWNSLGGVSRGSLRARADGFDFAQESYKGPDGREIRYSTHWRRVGSDAYEVSVESADQPSLNRRTVFRKVA